MSFPFEVYLRRLGLVKSMGFKLFFRPPKVRSPFLRVNVHACRSPCLASLFTSFFFIYFFFKLRLISSWIFQCKLFWYFFLHNPVAWLFLFTVSPHLCNPDLNSSSARFLIIIFFTAVSYLQKYLPWLYKLKNKPSAARAPPLKPHKIQ